LAQIKALSKAELYRQMTRFSEDPNTPFSWQAIADLCGYDPSHLRKVFIYKDMPLTEELQVRLSRALDKIRRGDVTLMYNKDRTRFLKYNNEPKPRVARGYQINLVGGELKIKPGLVNRNDYSQPTLKEQLED
jgi:AraC-like DNA-binding protein